MTAELWLEKRCKHGWTGPHRNLDSNRECPGGSRVRLDPDKVVFSFATDGRSMRAITVQDVIDALEEE